MDYLISQTMQFTFKIPLPFKSLAITINFDFVFNDKRKAYQQHLQSKKWFAFKARILKQRGFHCELCKSKKNLQLHHLTYKNFGNEKPNDVIILCEICHQKAHNKKA